MNCPACNVPLAMADRQGVEIDYCPRCRGVWLDRGEIDKIVEREVSAYGPMPRREAAPLMPEGPFYRDDRDHDRDHDRDRHYGDRDRDGHYRHDDKYRKKKKRESFLEDLFDFG
jgi:Zn-finger nucleic acid-binding protein